MILVRLSRDENFRFGGTAADLLSFQPDVRGSARRGEGGEGEVGGGEGEGEGEGDGEGEGEGEGEGGEEGEIKSQVEGADQGLRLEEGGEIEGEGEGHLDSVELEDSDCCGKPRHPFIMKGEEFDRWGGLT